MTLCACHCRCRSYRCCCCSCRCYCCCRCCCCLINVCGSGKSNFVSAFYKESRSDRCFWRGRGRKTCCLLCCFFFVALCAFISFILQTARSLTHCIALLFFGSSRLSYCAQMLFVVVLVVVVAVCHFNTLHAFRNRAYKQISSSKDLE